MSAKGWHKLTRDRDDRMNEPHWYHVPGRVELVGKHVDYGGGRSLTCATRQGLRVRAQALAEPIVRVRSQGKTDPVLLPLSAHAEASHGHWSNYIAAAVRRLARDFPGMDTGVELEIASTLPESAGLSSSSALVVAAAMALTDLNHLSDRADWSAVLPDTLSFAEYCGAMESGAPFGHFGGDAGVGSRGGAQDHVAILASRPGQIGCFSYLPARCAGYTPWPDTHVLVIAHSGVEAGKTTNARAAFNRLSDALRSTESNCPEYRIRREQFVEECTVIVPGVAAALAACDWITLGALVDRSQFLAEAVLGNQVPETVLLQRLARELGAIAASAFGAGFGGAVWAMVRADDAERFSQQWRTRYLERFPDRAADCRVLTTKPSGPAGVLIPDDSTA